MTISLPMTTSLPTERRPRPMGENHHQMASRARRGTNQRKFWVTPPRNIIARLPINHSGEELLPIGQSDNARSSSRKI